MNNILDRLKEIEVDLFRCKVDFLLDAIKDNKLPYEILIDINNFINTKVRYELVKPEIKF